jgi:hypothetical protein
MRVGTDYGDPEEGGPLPEAPEWAEGDDKLERPLSAFTDDELFEELRLRFDCFVFGGGKARTDNTDRLRTAYKGDMNRLIGLATQLLWDLQSSSGFFVRP